MRINAIQSLVALTTNTSIRPSFLHLNHSSRLTSHHTFRQYYGSTPSSLLSSTSDNGGDIPQSPLGPSPVDSIYANTLKQALLSTVDGETLVEEIGEVEGVQWPLFISIGKPDQLEIFLENNPTVDRGTILVDGYDNVLYKQLGFNRFDEADFGMKDVSFSTAANILRFLTLGPGSLWKYINNVPGLAPVEGGLDWTKLPDGGMRNGGTLIVCGNDVVYRWNDMIPSDVPDVRDVLKRAREAEMDRRRSDR